MTSEVASSWETPESVKYLQRRGSMKPNLSIFNESQTL